MRKTTHGLLAWFPRNLEDQLEHLKSMQYEKLIKKYGEEHLFSTPMNTLFKKLYKETCLYDPKIQAVNQARSRRDALIPLIDRLKMLRQSLSRLEKEKRNMVNAPAPNMTALSNAINAFKNEISRIDEKTKKQQQENQCPLSHIFKRLKF